MSEKSLEQQLTGAMKVRDLIEHLQTLPPGIPVGRVGHFGEFYPMTKSDFGHSKTRYVYLAETHSTLRSYGRMDIEAVEVECPDIGEAPD